MLKPSRARRLSDLLPKALGPSAARQGFAGAEILARWDAIVGPDIAAISTPQKLGVPPRSSTDNPDVEPPRATLTLKIEGAFALEVQHRSAEIIERVNAHLGWACVGALRLRQGGPTLRRPKPKRPRALPEPEPDDVRRIEAAAAAIDHEDLAGAIRRLGHAALARRASPKE